MAFVYDCVHMGTFRDVVCVCVCVCVQKVCIWAHLDVCLCGLIHKSCIRVAFCMLYAQ